MVNWVFDKLQRFFPSLIGFVGGIGADGLQGFAYVVRVANVVFVKLLDYFWNWGVHATGVSDYGQQVVAAVGEYYSLGRSYLDPFIDVAFVEGFIFGPFVYAMFVITLCYVLFRLFLIVFQEIVGMVFLG